MPLACSQLSVLYGRRKALTDFSFSMEKGEIGALIGPNGSGKSTALQALAGLIAPSQERAQIEGVAVASMSRRAIARKLAFLPQQPAAPDEMTIAQLVRQGRFLHVGLFRAYDRKDEEAIEWALESTGLTKFADRTLQELSGGERQRAWISAALAQEAGILHQHAMRVARTGAMVRPHLRSEKTIIEGKPLKNKGQGRFCMRFCPN